MAESLVRFGPQLIWRRVFSIVIERGLWQSEAERSVSCFAGFCFARGKFLFIATTLHLTRDHMAHEVAPRVCFLEIGAQTLQLAAVRYDGALKFIEQTETCWLGEPASLESGVRKIMAGAETEAGVLLLRPAGCCGVWLPPEKAGVLEDEVSRAEWLQELVEGGPMDWMVANSGEGVADLLPRVGVQDLLDRTLACGIAAQRCQSAWLARLGMLRGCLTGDESGICYLDLQSERVDLVHWVGGRVVAHRMVKVGLDSVIDGIERELGLRFRSSANRLFHGGTYDFSDLADRVLAPLAVVLAEVLAEVGPPGGRPGLICGGLTSAQQWVGSALARALGCIVPDLAPALRKVLQRGGVAWTEGAGAVDASRLGLWAAILAFDPRRPGETRDLWSGALTDTPCSSVPLLRGAAPVAVRVSSAPPMRVEETKVEAVNSVAPFAEAVGYGGGTKVDGVNRMVWQIVGVLALAAVLAGVAWQVMGPAHGGAKPGGAEVVSEVVVANGASRGNAELLVSTWPVGASVSLDGLPAVKSPARFAEVGAGRRSITVSSPGYRTEVREIELPPGGVLDLGVLVMQRNTGSLALTSRPAGLAFVLDPIGATDERRRFTGVTPTTLPEVVEGSYSLVVRRQGVRESKAEVVIKAGETREWMADLRTLEPGGEITVSKVTSERVTLAWTLPPGDYREYEIFMNSAPVTTGRGRIGTADVRVNTFEYVIPAFVVRGREYWFWVKVMLTNGTHGNVGPVAVRLD